MLKLMNSAFYKNHKQLINKIFVIFIVLVSFFLIWMLFIRNIYHFKQMEHTMENAGKMYFQRNLNSYPKNINGVSTVSLQKLYDRKLINALYIPGKGKLCSVDESWVKVKKVKSGYKYYKYLKCGGYESNGDHTGPIIKLNGGNVVNLELGKKYQESGIKSVIDETDGKIENNKVIISGKVDVNKLGTYKIKYTAYDSLKNKTVKYRTVKVVKTLASITKEDTKSTFYKGTEVNNYVLYSGMIWRIVGVNNDGTVKIITNDTLANISYSTGMEKDGYVYSWLNDYFYKKLYKPHEYINKYSWCNDKTDDINYNGKCNGDSIKANVGLITLSEYNQSINNDTYLNNGMTYWTMTKNNKDNIYANHEVYTMSTSTSVDYNGVRPVVNIKKDISVSGGNGTFEKPYILEGYKFLKAGSKLNEAISGEYIRHSGYLWRVMDVDSSGNTEIVMDSVLKNKDNLVQISFGDKYKNKSKIFDVKNKDSIGYKINKELKDYLITNKFVKHKYSVNYYKDGLKENTKTKEVKCLLSIPDITEVFSIGTADSEHGSYYVRNVLESKSKLLVVNSTTQTEEFYNFVFETNGVKVVTYVNKDVKIKSGKGTYNNPYELR